MSDSTHNTLVTLLLIAAAVIAFMLIFGRGFSSTTVQPASATMPGYGYQPASVIEVFRDRPVDTRSSTSYTYIPSTSYQSSSSYSTQNTYSYTCDGMGHCWTNQ